MPQAKPNQPPIDLSAGIVDPNKPIDLSAGIVDPSQQFQYVKLPDGSYGKFRADASDATIRAAIEKDFPNAYAPAPTPLKRAMTAAGDLGIGAGRGAASTAGNVGKLEYALMPKAVQNSGYGKDFAEGLDTLKDWANPENILQSVGKGAEQVGEFLIPGGAEEDAVKGIAKVLPMTEKAAPLVRALVGGVSSGAVNKAQGGGFLQGAGTGFAGGAAGEGMRALAPKVAESALGIFKGDRAFGRNIGQAALDETRGVRPATVARQAKEKIAKLTPELEAAADKASVRPAQKIAGFLPPPREEMPLAPAPSPRNPKMRPMVFDAQVNPEEPMEPRSGNAWAPISEYPGINPHYLSGSEHPELSGRIPTMQGVLYRRPEMSASIPKAFEENPSVSLGPARDAISAPMKKAFQEEAATLHGQLGNMADFLRAGRLSGEPIAETITPRRALDLKRGFSDEFLRWNPETHEAAESAGRKAYGALNKAFEEATPGAAPLNQRISNLIPVARRAESASRNAPTTQMLARRLAAPTGALVAPAMMGLEGYREGGMPLAMKEAAAGMLLPAFAATPAGQMTLARVLNSGVAQRIPRALMVPAMRSFTTRESAAPAQ